MKSENLFLRVKTRLRLFAGVTALLFFALPFAAAQPGTTKKIDPATGRTVDAAAQTQTAQAPAAAEPVEVKPVEVKRVETLPPAPVEAEEPIGADALKETQKEKEAAAPEEKPVTAEPAPLKTETTEAASKKTSLPESAHGELFGVEPAIDTLDGASLSTEESFEELSFSTPNGLTALTNDTEAEKVEPADTAPTLLSKEELDAAAPEAVIAETAESAKEEAKTSAEAPAEAVTENPAPTEESQAVAENAAPAEATEAVAENVAPAEEITAESEVKIAKEAPAPSAEAEPSAETSAEAVAENTASAEKKSEEKTEEKVAEQAVPIPSTETPEEGAIEWAVSSWASKRERIRAVQELARQGRQTVTRTDEPSMSIRLARPESAVPNNAAASNDEIKLDRQALLTTAPESIAAPRPAVTPTPSTQTPNAPQSAVRAESQPLPTGITVGPNDIAAKSAYTELPVGEGYIAMVGANVQGKLIELGVPKLDESGNPVLDEKGNPVLSPLRRGMKVKKGQVLGRQFNREFLARKIAAECQLVVAEKESKKVLEVEVAKSATLLAKASFDRAMAANEGMPSAVSPQELDEKKYDWERNYKSWEKSKYDLDIKVDQVEVSKAELLITEAQLEERELVSPIDGQIDEIKKNEGEWLREGDEVFQVIRLDKIQISAKFDATTISPEMIQGKPVSVYVTKPGLPMQKLDGSIVYARPIIEHSTLTAYAEVPNTQDAAGNWLLNPGMVVHLIVHP